MPDMSYYLDKSPAMAQHRNAYTTMVTNIMVLSGRNISAAEEDARNVLSVETKIAAAMTSPADERDEHGKRMTLAELTELLPYMDWATWFKMIGVPDIGTEKGGFMVVKNAAFLKQLNAVMQGLSFAEMRSYMRWQAAYNYAPFLSFKFEDELVGLHLSHGICRLSPQSHCVPSRVFLCSSTPGLESGPAF